MKLNVTLLSMKHGLNREIVLVAHNLRSCHNVGSLIRTAEGLGINKLFLTGYTPYPITTRDNRLPHIAEKVTKQISKTALGAENTLEWEHFEYINDVIDVLKANGYQLYALEQSAKSVDIHDVKPPTKIALVVGREVEGIEKEVINSCDKIVEIPMLGEKESFNVTQAAAMALFYLSYTSS